MKKIIYFILLFTLWAVMVLVSVYIIQRWPLTGNLFAGLLIGVIISKIDSILTK